MRTLLIAAMAMTLAACGGGGGGSSAPAAPAAGGSSTPAPAPAQSTETTLSATIVDGAVAGAQIEVVNGDEILDCDTNVITDEEGRFEITCADTLPEGAEFVARAGGRDTFTNVYLDFDLRGPAVNGIFVTPGTTLGTDEIDPYEDPYSDDAWQNLITQVMSVAIIRMELDSVSPDIVDILFAADSGAAALAGLRDTGMYDEDVERVMGVVARVMSAQATGANASETLKPALTYFQEEYRANLQHDMQQEGANFIHNIETDAPNQGGEEPAGDNGTWDNGQPVGDYGHLQPVDVERIQNFFANYERPYFNQYDQDVMYITYIIYREFAMQELVYVDGNEQGYNLTGHQPDWFASMGFETNVDVRYSEADSMAEFFEEYGSGSNIGLIFGMGSQGSDEGKDFQGLFDGVMAAIQSGDITVEDRNTFTTPGSAFYNLTCEYISHACQ